MVYFKLLILRQDVGLLGLLTLGMDFIASHNLDVTALLAQHQPLPPPSSSSVATSSNFQSLVDEEFLPLILQDEPSLPRSSPYDYELLLHSPISDLSARPLIHMTFEDQAFLQQEINRLLHQGFITSVPPTSHYSVPFVVTNGSKKRLVVDYRQLNQLTVVIPAQLPTFDELTMNLHGKYVSTLDITAAYHHILLTPSSAAATVFKTPFGFFQFQVLAFGMVNAPELFQRMISELLFPHHEFARVYMDDILIVSDSLDDHVANVKQVLLTLKENGLHVNLSKSNFFAKEVKWLGHNFLLVMMVFFQFLLLIKLLLLSRIVHHLLLSLNFKGILVIWLMFISFSQVLLS